MFINYRSVSPSYLSLPRVPYPCSLRPFVRAHFHILKWNCFNRVCYLLSNWIDYLKLYQYAMVKNQITYELKFLFVCIFYRYLIPQMSLIGSDVWGWYVSKVWTNILTTIWVWRTMSAKFVRKKDEKRLARKNFGVSPS